MGDEVAGALGHGAGEETGSAGGADDEGVAVCDILVEVGFKFAGNFIGSGKKHNGGHGAAGEGPEDFAVFIHIAGESGEEGGVVRDGGIALAFLLGFFNVVVKHFVKKEGEEIIFIGEVLVEGAAADHGFGAELVHGNVFKIFFTDKIKKGVHEAVISFSDSKV